MCHLMRAAVVMATIVASGPADVGFSAECIAVSIADAKRGATLVFEATVGEVEALNHPEYQATLTVHRVWKGDVPKQITVYYAPSVEGPSLKEGDRRIIFAVRQSAAMRKALKILPASPSREAWVPPCSGAWSADASVIEQLGRARPPNDKR